MEEFKSYNQLVTESLAIIATELKRLNKNIEKMTGTDWNKSLIVTVRGTIDTPRE